LRGDGFDTQEGSVSARGVVVCTDRSIPELGALEREIYHVQTFLGMTAPLSEAALQRIFPSGPVMTWDSDLIYSYFRLADRNRLLLGGGQLLHTYASRPPASLERFARHARAEFAATFPEVDVQIESAWSGMLGVSKDLQPILGPDPERESICFVGAATGLPWAAALGRYAAERILDGRRDFDAAFSPAREFVIGPRLQALLSTPLAFALANAVTRMR
jgi:gamma-glutamylputrescine oxidase